MAPMTVIFSDPVGTSAASPLTRRRSRASSPAPNIDGQENKEVQECPGEKSIRKEVQAQQLLDGGDHEALRPQCDEGTAKDLRSSPRGIAKVKGYMVRMFAVRHYDRTQKILVAVGVILATAIVVAAYNDTIFAESVGKLAFSAIGALVSMLLLLRRFNAWTNFFAVLLLLPAVWFVAGFCFPVVRFESFGNVADWYTNAAAAASTMALSSPCLLICAVLVMAVTTCVIARRRAAGNRRSDDAPTNEESVTHKD